MLFKSKQMFDNDMDYEYLYLMHFIVSKGLLCFKSHVNLLVVYL